MYLESRLVMLILYVSNNIQGVFEMGAQILNTSYWLHVELGKNI
jgi:hypothetical protein